MILFYEIFCAIIFSMKTRFLSLTIAISFFCALSLSCSRNTIVRDSKNSATTEKEAVSGLSENIPPQFQNVTLKYNSKEELQQSDRLVLGMHTGFVMVDKLTRELFPQAKIEYYKTNAKYAPFEYIKNGAITGYDIDWAVRFARDIGFGMNFGAYVSEMIRTGILAVDKGQMEAALALGYPKSKAFVKMILPQAAQHFLPVYQGEFISLVKMTSVVGYIAIQDLTKASDIIRSRTYEAFFPLITTAILYFIISWLLTRALSALQTRIDPKKRRR